MASHSTDWQPAVSPAGNQLGAALTADLCAWRRSQNAILRYSRLTICATNLRLASIFHSQSSLPSQFGGSGLMLSTTTWGEGVPAPSTRNTARTALSATT